MRQILHALAAVAAAASLLAGTAAAFTPFRAAADPVYIPTQFAATNLRSHLRVGQTLRIMGTLQPWWWPNTGVIVQTQGWRRIGVFVIYGPHNPIISRLRRLPLVAPLIPPTADHPLMGQAATYRVRAIPCRPSIPLCPMRSPALQLQDGGTP